MIPWLAAGGTTLIYLLTAARPRLPGRDRAGIVLGVPAGLLALGIRSSLVRTSVHGFLWTVAALNTLILVVTLGRPYLLFDVSTKAKQRRRMPRDQRETLKRKERQVALTQVAFTALLIVGVLLVDLLGIAIFD